jgi:nucleoside-diphosphate-sugar epimerase
MKVAVTGATGFIGRHLLREFESRGIAVVAAGHSAGDWPSSGFHRVVRHDIRTLETDPYRMLGSPDVLVHLAWAGLPNYGSERHLMEELPAQERFLGGLLESGLRGLVVAGTCMEYGMREGQLREDDPAQPVNPYAMAKNELRIRLEALQRAHRFSLTWARLFYLFGAGQAPTSLYSQLESAASRGVSSLDVSSGEQLRDFMPVEEATAALARLACTGADFGTVNVCSGQPVAVRSIAEEWIRRNNWSITLNLGARAPSPYEPGAFWGDRAKLDRCLRHEGKP